MVKKDKLYSRIKNNQKNVRFQDFCTLLEYFGFSLRRTTGSHYLYQHDVVADVMNIQTTKDNMAKAYQVKQFLKLIDAHDLRLEEESDE